MGPQWRIVPKPAAGVLISYPLSGLSNHHLTKRGKYE